MNEEAMISSNQTKIALSGRQPMNNITEQPVVTGTVPASALPPRAVGSIALPSPRQAVLGTIIVLVMVLGFWMLWRFRYVALAVVAAAFLHVGMKPAVEWLYRRGLRRELGVTIVYALLLLAVVGFVFVLAPMLSAQVGTFTASLPDYYRLVRNSMLTSDIDLLMRVARLLPPGGDLTALRAILLRSVAGDASTITSPWNFLGGIGQALFFGVAVLAMAFYWTMDRHRITYQFVVRLPAARRDGARELIAELETKVGAFIRGQLILCTLIGALSLVAFFLIGLPYALALAVVAFVFEAIPMVGPALTALVAGLVAASIGPDKLAWTLAAGLLIQTAENNIIVPRVMDKTVGVHPIVTLLAITAFSLLFGFVGALLAIPLAAMIQVLMDRYLFSGDSYIEEATPALQAIATGGLPIAATAAATDGSGRSHFDVLRAEAMDLAQDVRKQLRTSDVEASAQVSTLEDEIEQTALEIANLLAAPPPPTATVSQTASRGTQPNTEVYS